MTGRAGMRNVLPERIGVSMKKSAARWATTWSRRVIQAKYAVAAGRAAPKRTGLSRTHAVASPPKGAKSLASQATIAGWS
jgi:hypothetical protein